MHMADEVQLVVFGLGAHQFAFNVFDVERVLRYENPNPLPRTPPYLLGTLRYGNEAIPVVDLRRRLETADEVEDNTRIAVVQCEQGRLGLVVDSVLEVLKISADSISPPPPLVRGLAAECISGILNLEERTVVVLAVGKLLATDERLALSSLMAEISDV